VKQIGIFDEAIALKRLSQLGDKLEWLESVMDWGMFQAALDEMKPDKTQTVKGGRPPLSNLMMFKIVILKELNNASYDQMEFLINDRLSWKRFLGLGLPEKAPDSTTIRDFYELLKETGMYEDIFQLFNNKMEEIGVITHKGTIVDASFVDVPRQRNTREENKTIKEGGVPEAWELDENSAMLEQKDLDAEWAKKNKEVHYGYKDHALVDAESKMIIDYRVTGASVHDSQRFMEMITERIGAFWADSAYMSAAILDFFKEKFPKIELRICEKGHRNHPLTDEQRANNTEKSRIRSRIEHVFGHMTNSMGGMFLRCIGIERAECAVGLKNLAYNISRYASLRRLGTAPKMA